MIAKDVIYACALLEEWRKSHDMRSRVMASNQISVQVWNQSGSGNYPMPANYTGPPDAAMRAYCLAPIDARITELEAELSAVGVTKFDNDEVRYQLVHGVTSDGDNARRYKLLHHNFRQWRNERKEADPRHDDQ